MLLSFLYTLVPFWYFALSLNFVGSFFLLLFWGCNYVFLYLIGVRVCKNSTWWVVDGPIWKSFRLFG